MNTDTLAPIQEPLLPKADHYALFIWHQPAPPPRVELISRLLGQPAEETIEENYEQPAPLPKQLVFLKMATDAKEISTMISKHPTMEYVVLRGQLMTVKSSTVVTVDGKNLATLDSEWSE